MELSFLLRVPKAFEMREQKAVSKLRNRQRISTDKSVIAIVAAIIVAVTLGAIFAMRERTESGNTNTISQTTNSPGSTKQP